MTSNFFPSGDNVELLHMQSMFLCSLWKLERKDGVPEYFTNWDEDISTIDPERGAVTFRSSAGVALSATSRERGLRAQSLTAGGLIDGLDEELLAGGVYDMAEITEWIVDARFPWMRGMEKNVYWVTNVEYTNEQWRFELEGIGRRMKETLGVPFNRPCRFSLGQDGCRSSGVGRTGVDIATYTYGRTTPLRVAKVNADWPRQAFQVNLSVGVPAIQYNRNTFPYGRAKFSDRKNANLQYEVLAYDKTKLDVGADLSGEFQLYQATVEDIQVGDLVVVEEGCDGSYATCDAEFSNKLNFGGNQNIPGTQKARQSAKLSWLR